jgi:hypothetical protein
MTVVMQADEYEHAVDAAADAFLRCVRDTSDGSRKVLLDCIVAALQSRGGVVGACFKAKDFRDVLDAVVRRSLAILADELVPRIRERISPEMAEHVEGDLARLLGNACAMIEGLMPTTH